MSHELHALRFPLGVLLLGAVACSHPPEPAAPASAPASASATPSPAPAPSDPPPTPAMDTKPAGDSGAPPARPLGAPGATCGGIAGLQCAEGLFCDFPPEAHCGAADQSGTCQPRPGGCRKVDEPVCGCDDRTYPTECVAHAAGVSVLRAGECPKK